MAYKNAAIILPPELLRQVREYHVGLLYIPPAEGQERDKEILRLSQQGLKSSQIAEIFYISIRRVQYILREARQMRSNC
jgi:DNA-binding NarL/FixJ family response regulator